MWKTARSRVGFPVFSAGHNKHFQWSMIGKHKFSFVTAGLVKVKRQITFLDTRCSKRLLPPDGDSHCFWRTGTWTDHLRSQPTCLKHVEESIAGWYWPCRKTHVHTPTHRQIKRPRNQINDDLLWLQGIFHSVIRWESAGWLTWISSVGYDEHAQWAQADVPLVSLGQERPVHVPRLDHCHPCCIRTWKRRLTHNKLIWSTLLRSTQGHQVTQKWLWWPPG